MASVQDIPISRLRLDSANPRLDDGQQTQKEALAAMMGAQGSKLVALARDIAKVGLNPLDRFLVLQAEDDPKDYVVLEGNRRLTALKLLINPELAAEILSAAEVSALKELAPSSSYRGDSDLDCVVVDTRDDAAHWLRVRHGGQLDGAGTVSWGATEKARFDSRSGKSSPELQLINFAISRGILTEEQANAISITNLRRLLSDSHVRETIGVEINRKDGRISTRFPADEIAKPITKLVSDLADDSFRVARIYTKEHREDYMKEFGRASRPNQKTILPASVELRSIGSSSSGGHQKGKKTKPRTGRVSARRRTVAPGSLALKIGQARPKDIYRELQRLRVEDFTNAGAVLLRVFLELTVDGYLKKRGISTKSQANLANKLQAVHDDLLGRAVMTNAELAPIRKAISGNDLLAASIPLLNLYVHDSHLSPSPNDVRVSWDNLELFFTRTWT
jgi:hypothetical protein